MARVRDSQRSRVYEAEYEFRRECSGRTARGSKAAGLLPEIRFKNLEQAQDYVDRTLAIPGIRRYARRYCEVVERRGYVFADYMPGIEWDYIRLPGDKTSWAMRETVVLHEIAHHMTRNTKYAGHGPEFCKRFLLVTEKTMGLDSANRLAYHLVQNKVRIG